MESKTHKFTKIKFFIEIKDKHFKCNKYNDFHILLLL